MALSKKQQHIVDQLERRVGLCREFMNDWLLFNQILSAYPNPGVNKAQLENQFLKIKSKLARSHRVLKDTLQEDYQIDANTMNIISGATNLESIYAQSDVSVKKLQTEWHRAFISINETLGGIEDKRQRALNGEKIMLVSGQVGKVSVGLDSNMKTLLIAVGIIVALVAIYFLDPGGIATLWVESFRNLMR